MKRVRTCLSAASLLPLRHIDCTTTLPAGLIYCASRIWVVDCATAGPGWHVNRAATLSPRLIDSAPPLSPRLVDGAASLPPGLVNRASPTFRLIGSASTLTVRFIDGATSALWLIDRASTFTPWLINRAATCPRRPINSTCHESLLFPHPINRNRPIILGAEAASSLCAGSRELIRFEYDREQLILPKFTALLVVEESAGLANREPQDEGLKPGVRIGVAAGSRPTRNQM